jgi:GNAT superfamily N-acetyltransferase
MSDSLAADPDEHLTDGWEPDTPESDTLVRAAVEVHAAWLTATAESKGRPWRRTDSWVGAYIGDHGELTNMVMPLRPTDATGFETLVSDVGDLVPATAPYALLSPFPTPDLTSHGLLRVGHPPLMARPAAPGPDTLPDGVEVREVGTDEELALARRIMVEGYPLPDTEPLASTDRAWIGYVDGEPAAASAAYLVHGMTLVVYVAALPTGRGRGVGAAVTWAATVCQPERPAVLLASDDGRPVYERMGFVAIERWTAWLRPASSLDA